MYRRIIIAALLLALCGWLTAADNSKKIDKELQSAPNDSTALALIHKYLKTTDDIEDLRTLQNYWIAINDSACAEYFTKLKKKYPKDPKYIYL